MTDNSADIGPAAKALHGTVLRKLLGHYGVRVEDGRLFDCGLSSKLRKRFVYPTADPSSIRRHVVAVKRIRQVDPVAIGDVVELTEGGSNTGAITEVRARRNRFSRRAPGPAPLEQIIAANLDQVAIVLAAAQPKPQWHLLDRFLADAEFAEIPALICVTKMDLVDEARNDEGSDCEEEASEGTAIAESALRDDERAADSELATEDRELRAEDSALPPAASEPPVLSIREEMLVYERLGYRVVFTSAPTGAGLDELKEMLRGRLSIFVGKSGVGKTTLLNALEPGLGLRVKEVSKSTGKGTHATSHLEMFEVNLGRCGGGEGGVGEGDPPAVARIVDTPGMKEFALWDSAGVDKAWLFREMRAYLGQCRFGGDCSHSHEPGCAIKNAVETGEIAYRRYRSYLSLAGAPVGSAP
jgi:ribosome biogenesis GTPase